jgi:hypothetical protein
MRNTSLRVEGAVGVTSHRGKVLSVLIRLFIVLSLMLPQVVWSQTDTKSTVKSLVQQARAAYKNGLYETAARQFAQAFELSGNAKYLYDAAISFQQVQSWDQCIGYMGRYLELAPISPKRDRARNARDNCAARQNKSQQLSIETTPIGASVKLGNVQSPIVGTTPLRLDLPPGVQRVFIEKAGYESVIRDIDLKKGTPLRLSVDLRELNAQGYLFVDSSISGATVFLNGQSKRLTPFDKAITLKAGLYQLHINRTGYQPWTRQIQIEALTVHHVPVRLNAVGRATTWRTPTGWVSQVLGALSMTGAYVAMKYANRQYRDTDDFERLAQVEKLGYGVGGGLMGIGISLVVADWISDPMVERDRNPTFGQAVPMPKDAVGVKKMEQE